MAEQHWSEKYPDLKTFLEEQVRPVCDPYGLTYYFAIDRAYEDYGIPGLSLQLVYVANNLLPGNKPVDKELICWAKKLEKDK